MGVIQMISHGTKIKVFTGNSNPALAKAIAAKLGVELSDATVTKFSDGEISVSIGETVRGVDVFVVQSTCSPVNDNFMELLIMIDAFRRASAGRITAVMPYFGYARQDRKSKARDPISAKLCAQMLEAAGADRVLTMDLHASQIQGFFDIPVDNLLGTSVLMPYFVETIGKQSSEYVIVSPDLGSVTRARKFTEKLDLPLAIVDKRRQRANVSEVMNIIGDVRDKKVLLVDDMIDTAGTLCNAANALVEKGGAKSVIAAATHGVLSGPAIDRIRDSVIDKVVLLDTIVLPPEKRIDKFIQLDVAPVFSEAIERIYEDKPVSIMFV
jgi:ribose-phosphate pyrophosphokinase